MSKEDVARIDDEAMAAWDAHDVDGVVGMLADEFVWSDVRLPEPIRTLDGVREYVQGWFTAFPDMQIKQLNRVVSDDGVAGELEFTGTNTGAMAMGDAEMPPTGKAVVGRGAYFARIEGGRIAEFSAHPDVAGMMMQLGMMPG